MMVVHGHIENGKIVLDEEAPLLEGAKVEVRFLHADEEAAELPQLPTLFERYRNIIGKAIDLPSDFAENHDHYIHGAPKNQ